MALVLAVPPSINFLAAAVLLAWAIDHLRLAFEALDAEERQESEVRATLEHQGIASECYELTTVD